MVLMIPGLAVVAEDKQVDEVMKAIRNATFKKDGDGEIFVTRVREVNGYSKSQQPVKKLSDTEVQVLDRV
jgi:nitrogen regulatory protein PII